MRIIERFFEMTMGDRIALAILVGGLMGLLWLIFRIDKDDEGL